MIRLFILLALMACGKDPAKKSQQTLSNTSIASKENMIQISCQHFNWCMDECRVAVEECLLKCDKDYPEKDGKRPIEFGVCDMACRATISDCQHKKIEIPESDLCKVNAQSSEHDFSKCEWFPK